MKSISALVSLIFLAAFVTMATSSGLKKVATERSRIGILTSYYVAEFPETWSDARMDCRDNGGSLVAPTSAAIDSELTGIIDRYSLGTSPLWTDGRYDDAALRWAWSTTRRPFQLPFKWIKPYQPTEESSVSCMAVSGTLSDYGWNSFPCNTKFLYVCSNVD